MLNSISWTTYFFTISVAVVLYYSFILIKFYSRELRALLFVRMNPLSSIASVQNSGDNENKQTKPGATEPQFYVSNEKMPSKSPTDYLVDEDEELAIRLKQAIGDAVTKNYLKQEFIASMKGLLKNYHYIKGSPLMEKINKAIATESEKYGYVQLNAEEQREVWNG